MTLRTRFQWPVVGDDLRLEMVNYRTNQLTDVASARVSVYRAGANPSTPVNPRGLGLVMPPLDAFRVSDGRWAVEFALDPNVFMNGTYWDWWDVVYSDGNAGRREACFEVYPNRDVGTTTYPDLTWQAEMSPRKVRYDSIFRMLVRVLPIDGERGIASHWTNLLYAGTVEFRLVRLPGVYDYVPCEDGGNDDINSVLPWTDLEHRGDSVWTYLIDTTSAGLNMYPGEYAGEFRVSLGDLVWYTTQRNYLQIMP